MRNSVKIGIAAAVASCVIACQTSETPSPTTPVTSSTARPIVPKIKGAITSAATGELWTSGGIVYVEDAPKQPEVATSAKVQIFKREFRPEISVVTTGGVVTFQNREALTHHVFSPDIRNWDTGYLKENGTSTRRFDEVGAYVLLCNIHPEMLGYVLVIPSTYYGRVNPGGEYVIGDVPAGTYKVTAWAPRTPPVTQTVTVGATGAPAVVDFALR
jgi:plastocyanin